MPVVDPRAATQLHSPAEEAAVVDLGYGEVIVSTASFGPPRTFPGGDIGELAVNGTVNKLAMRGACPLAICLAYIVEEGLDLDEQRRVTASARRAARFAGVRVLAGDTKVVGRGAADGLYITATGIGVALPHAWVAAANVRPDDVVLISGPIGLHGTAILNVRESLGFHAEIASDTRPLHGLVAAMLEAGGEHVHTLRAPTRGGLAGALNELAEVSAVGIELDEGAIPVPKTVAAACDLLGLDPMHVANEGCLVAFVAPDAALEVLVAMRAHPAGTQARPIGRAVADSAFPNQPAPPTSSVDRVRMHTLAGDTRVVDMLVGEQLPRIC